MTPNDAILYNIFPTNLQGLAEGLTPHLWSEPYLEARCGNLLLHKLRCFRKRGNGECVETEWKSMKLHDYLR